MSIPVLLLSAAALGQQAARPVAPAQELPAVPPNEYVQRVVQHELDARDDSAMMYRDWRMTPEGSKTKEMIETKAGMVARLIAINDRPLTPEQCAALLERSRSPCQLHSRFIWGSRANAEALGGISK